MWSLLTQNLQSNGEGRQLTQAGDLKPLHWETYSNPTEALIIYTERDCSYLVRTLSSGHGWTSKLVLCGPFCLASMKTSCQGLFTPLKKVPGYGVVSCDHIAVMRLHSGSVGVASMMPNLLSFPSLLLDWGGGLSFLGITLTLNGLNKRDSTVLL